MFTKKNALSPILVATASVAPAMIQWIRFAEPPTAKALRQRAGRIFVEEEAWLDWPPSLSVH
jgi:hypothetical protein